MPDDSRVVECGEVTGEGLVAVLGGEEDALGGAGIVSGLGAEGEQGIDALFELLEARGIADLAQVGELRGGEQASGGPGMAGDEDQIAFLYALGGKGR